MSWVGAHAGNPQEREEALSLVIGHAARVPAEAGRSGTRINAVSEERRRRVKTYESDEVVVTFDPGLCIHARECVHGLSDVFDVEKKPWVQPEHASADAIVDVVSRCPTGALHTMRRDGGTGEEPDASVTVSEGSNGPLYIRGVVSIVDEDGGVIREDHRVALCRCGASADKPFCDGSHTEAGFTA